ncbi:hypothetical protein [Paenibacillus agaridevorans]|uniref:hypothetical protein n=1 Tax=Paenibacillus agaridevorans TaxID=171404 RepID=UPI001BE48448|nr:hypothetical protein [Paenibacillus agaridevorans]
MSGKQGTMIVYVGTTPNIGTTTAAFASAMRLAEATDKPVGYLCLHLKSAKLHRFLDVDEPETTLDKLQPELRSAALTPAMLQRAMFELPGQRNLRVLFGSLNREQAEYFTDREIQHLLDVAERTFACVVLDVGAYWDNAATVCAIQRANVRVVVTTGALSHFQEDGKRWIGDVSPLFKVRPEQYECLVIRAPWGRDAYSAAQIGRELGSAGISELRLSQTLFASLDQGAFHLWLKEDKAGKAAMSRQAGRIVSRYGLGLPVPRAKLVAWPFKRMGARERTGSA